MILAAYKPRCTPIKSSLAWRLKGAARCTPTLSWNLPLMQQEVVEASGHLIDSHVMEQIFDTVVECNGRFEVEQFKIGRTNAEASYLRLKLETAQPQEMQQLLGHLLGLGCTPVHTGDATLAMV